jgi:hypothetical protein
MDHAEYGGVRSYAERQRHYCNYGEAGVLLQHAYAIAKVPPDICHNIAPSRSKNYSFTPRPSLDSPQFLDHRSVTAELDKRSPEGFLLASPCVTQLFVPVLKVLGQLFDYLVLTLRLKLKTANPSPDMSLPFRHVVPPPHGDI